MSARASGVPWPAPAATFLISLAAYLATLSPSIGFIDAGELAAAACSFGIPHPTGYPLFVLLSGTWCALAPGRAIAGLNLLSALLGAGAAAVATDAAGRLLARGFAKPSWLAAVSAGLALALGRTTWSSALGVEVHSLQALLALGALDATLRALPAPGEPARPWREWRPAALLLGLAFANHLTSVQLVPAIGVAWLAGAAAVGGRLRASLRLLPWTALGLLPYAFLPLRSLQQPALDWGDPSTPGRFLAHVTAREYGSRFFTGVVPFLDSLREFARGLPAEVGPAAALAGLGLVGAWRRDRVGAVVLVVLIATSLAVAASYSIPDLAPYFFMARAGLALLAGIGIGAAAGRSAAAGVAAAALSVVPLPVLNRDVSERGNFLVEDFAANMFRSLEPGAVVITYQWDHFVSPALYLQAVEAVRTDVLVVDKRLLQRGWYARQLARREPALWAPLARELRELQLATEVPGVGEPARRVDALLQGLVDSVYPSRPVYVTLDVEDSFPAGYLQVAEGLALRLYRPADVPPAGPVWDDFRYRRFARRDAWTDRLRQYYAVMLMGRGAFLEDAGQAAAAAAYYRRALGFEPSPAVASQIAGRLARAAATRPP